MTHPFARFLALGIVLFALQRATLRLAPPATAPAAARAEVTLDDEALLARAAVALGLHARDPVALRRLAENLRISEIGGEPGGEETDEQADARRVREAFALGMHETDVVVRRRLANQLRLRAAAAVRSHEPGEADLATYLAAHADRFRMDERRRLVVVSLVRERHAALDVDAARLSALLRRREPGGSAPEVAGDALPLPSRFEATSERELAELYGWDVAHPAFALAPGTWSAPARSAFGVHLVRVAEVIPARSARLDEVRSAVREAVLAEREDRALATLLGRLREAARDDGAAPG